MTEVAGHGAKLFLYLVDMEFEDFHMSSFKPSLVDELKLWWNSLAKSSRQVYSATLAVGTGAAFAVALYYSLSYISQLMATAVMVMYSGRIVERGSKRDLFLNPQHPYTRALLDSIPPLEGKRPRRLRSIPGSPPSLLDDLPGYCFAPRCPKRFDKCAAKPELVGTTHAAACFLAVTQ